MKISEKFLNFWFVFSLFFIALVVVFFLVIFNWEFLAGVLGLLDITFAEDLSRNTFNSEPVVLEPGKFLDAISNSLALLIGAPVALAGSFVAIVLAQRALAVSERQEYHENAGLVDEHIKNLLDIYWEMAAAFREYFNNVKDIKSYYLGVHNFRDSEELVADEKFIVLSNALSNSKQKFILSCLKSLKNPTIRSYFNDLGDNLVINSVQNDLSKRKDLFDIEKSIFVNNLPELFFAVESGEESNETSFILQKLKRFYFLSKELKDDREERLHFEYFSTLSSPDDILLAGVILKTDSMDLLIHLDELRNVYDEVSQEEITIEFDNISYEVNIGAAFLIHFFEMFLPAEQLKEHFIDANEHILMRNKRVLELVEAKFSDIDVSILLPKYLEEYIEFIKLYRLQELQDAKYVGCSEDYRVATMYKEVDGEWRDEADW